MHNLGTVYRFEVARTLKKKSFWILALGFPVIIAVIFAIIYFSNRTTSDIESKLKDQTFSIQYTDESGLIRPSIAKEAKAREIVDKNAGIQAVKSGSLDAYFYYPKDITKQKPEVYGKDVGLFDNGRYESVAQALLQQSVGDDVSGSVKLVLGGKMSFASTTYRDGQEYNGFMQLIAPGAFLLLFYFIIAFFGNQMLTSTTEEKENRVIEMILTTIRADTLILGKILSIFTLVIIQLVTIVLPVLVLYFSFGDRLHLPNIDLANISFDAVRMTVGAIIFALSLALFTGLLVAIGAATPTAKEAGGFFGMTMILIFGPLYALSLFVSAPHSPIVEFLTLFPFTAPIPLLLRNAVGNLSTLEVVLGISILFVTAALVFMLAVRLFRFGALEYSRKLSLKEVFTRKA